MIIWRTDKPTGDTILVKYVKKWMGPYDVLYYNPHDGEYYDCCGEHVPYSNIQQWEQIESVKEENL